LWMKAYTVMLQWSQFTWFLKIWKASPAWSTFLVLQVIYTRPRIWSS
jgi:hypothetical protein